MRRRTNSTCACGTPAEFRGGQPRPMTIKVDGYAGGAAPQESRAEEVSIVRGGVFAETPSFSAQSRVEEGHGTMETAKACLR